jgi:hypothetical protein
MAAILFDNIIQGLSQAIQKAQAAIDKYQYEVFKELLEVEEYQDDGKGNRIRSVRTRTVSIPVFKPDGTSVVRDIPLVTLLKHDSLHLDEVKIKMAFRASWNDQSEGMTIDLVSSGENDPAAEPAQEVQLVFKRGEPPEGIVRINNELTKII